MTSTEKKPTLEQENLIRDKALASQARINEQVALGRIKLRAEGFTFRR